MPLNTEIRTGEIDEILGKAPGGLVRWGIGVFFCVILLIIGGSWFFKYPDMIAASIEITGNMPPAEVKAKVNGKMETLFVKNNQKVTKNQVLGLIENPADFSAVAALKSLLDSLPGQNQSAALIAKTFAPVPIGRLGELQAHYSAMLAAQSHLVSFTEISYHHNKIEAARVQLADHALLYNYLNDQRNTLEEDYDLALKDHNRYARLFEQGVIPEQEFEKAKSQYLARKLAFENSRTMLVNLQIQINQLKGSIVELEMQHRQQYESLQSAFDEATANLKAQAGIWEQRYVLRAPQSGTCVFTRFWAANQNIGANETVFTILPDKHGEIKGMLLLPVTGAGKVALDQMVNIRLDDYPYMEFGMIEGRVEGISAVPEQGVYYATVTFPMGLKTAYGKELVFSQRLTGTAEIITNDIRLFHRILQPMKHLLRKNL